MTPQKEALFELKIENNFGKAGPVEQQIQKQIDYLINQKLLTAAHAGTAALAIIAAREVDNMFGGAPSGRAQMIKAANDVFEMLPKPLDEVASSDFDKAIHVIHSAAEPRLPDFTNSNA